MKLDPDFTDATTQTRVDESSSVMSDTSTKAKPESIDVANVSDRTRSLGSDGLQLRP